MATAVRRFDVVRRATARICDSQEKHRGQGLLINLEQEGKFVLTCHHVIAPLQEGDLFVQLRQSDGNLGKPIPAQYEGKWSRPTRDAVVLRVDAVCANEMPLLHELDPSMYDGSLPEHVNGFSYGVTQTFNARLSTSTPLDIKVPIQGSWPDPPARYQLPFVYRLADLSDARQGISGSVISYENGVLGLVHFSRAGGADFQLEGYLVPLSTWAEGWLELAKLIEPLVDSRLRMVAVVKRASKLEIGTDVVVAGYRPDAYIERPVVDQAQTALNVSHGVIIVGKPKSGKTRLAVQLIQRQPDAIVVVPREARLPHAFEKSSFWAKQIIIFFDDLHRASSDVNPLEWQRSFDEASGRHSIVICTTRDGSDWKTLNNKIGIDPFLNLFRNATVFTSKVEDRGGDMSAPEGLRLAESIGLSKEQFRRRFDGTAGSLTLDLSDMRERYKRLREEYRGEVAMSRLLDSSKLAHKAGLWRLEVTLLRTIAEKIRGTGPIAPESWDTILRRTNEEAFGRLDSTNTAFQVYQPYLEECVLYEPSQADIEGLLTVLNEKEDYSNAINVANTLVVEYGSLVVAERVLRNASNHGKRGGGTRLRFIRFFSRDKSESDNARDVLLGEGGTFSNWELAVLLSNLETSLTKGYIQPGKNEHIVVNILTLIDSFGPNLYTDVAVFSALDDVFKVLSDIDNFGQPVIVLRDKIRKQMDVE
jgi:hypothetical protein